jgi:hypothetical protein
MTSGGGWVWEFGVLTLEASIFLEEEVQRVLAVE